MIITKIIEWDMGHRIPNHKSVCRNLHGHRYKLKVLLKGDLQEVTGASDEGMVLDFGDIKKILTKEVHDYCDHSFMYSSSDKLLEKIFEQNQSFRSIVVDFIPTAENIAFWAFDKLFQKLEVAYGNRLQLHQIELWETPTSSAVITIEDYLNRKDV